jgi:hypothetical protein
VGGKVKMNITSGKSGDKSNYGSVFDDFFSCGKNEKSGSNFSWLIFIIIFFLIIGKESCLNFLNRCCGEQDHHHHHNHDDECNNFGFNGNLLWIIGILVVLWLLRGNRCEEVCKGRIEDVQTNDECC